MVDRESNVTDSLNIPKNKILVNEPKHTTADKTNKVSIKRCS